MRWIRPDSQSIAEVEEALVVRARELFHIAGDNIEEERALDDTMYALRALRNEIRMCCSGKAGPISGSAEQHIRI